MLPQSGELEICLGWVVFTFIDYPGSYRLGAKEQDYPWKHDEEQRFMVSMLLPTVQRQTRNCLHLPAGVNTVRSEDLALFWVLWEFARVGRFCCNW